MLSGQGHSWANLRSGREWTDYRFQLRVKLIRREVHLNVRLNDTGRYFIGFHEGGVNLSKQLWPDTFFELAGAGFPVEMDVWHTVAITVEGDHVRVSVDGTERLDYVDSDNPLLQGSIALETIHDENALVHFDDVLVEGEPPPKPPALPPLSPDVNNDGVVDMADVLMVARALGQSPVLDRRADVVKDGVVDILDLSWVASNIGKKVPLVATLPDLSRMADLPGGHISDIAFAPSSRNIVYLASNVNAMGIWRSDDAGETWRRVLYDGSEPGAGHTNHVAVHPNDSDTVLATDLHGRIVKTTDGRRTWREVYESAAPNWWVTFAPSNPLIVYAGDADGRVLKSNDGGSSWLVMASLPCSARGLYGR